MRTNHIIRNICLAVATTALVALSGCYHVAYRTNKTPGGQVHTQKASFFLWGLAGGATFDLDTLCPSGVASVSDEKSFVDGLLAGVTAGLYTPMSVTVECAGGAAYLIAPDGTGGTLAMRIDDAGTETGGGPR